VRATPRLVAARCGRPLGPQPQLRAGVRFVQPDLDWHGVLPAIRAAPAKSRGPMTWRLLRPYLGARELGVFDPRDPGPLIALFGQFAGRRVARIRARLHRRR
jgi:hypothetical protein